MVFWGAMVSAEGPQQVRPKANNVLHVSNACLDAGAAPGAAATLLVEHGGARYAVASLREGGVQLCPLDLFFGPEGAKMSVKGKAKVYVTGYFEPSSFSEEEAMATTGPARKVRRKAAA
mmetsp:Transcript_123472/g.320691  ORF Transcript_123472/g.320691 Transcript_123472/m.320691 type:complete len:119 (-) Transcript_123472:28-384(-)